VSGNAKKVVLVVPLGRQYFEDLEEWGPLPSVESELALIRAYDAEVVALALNTLGCSAEQVAQARAELGQKFGIPVVDPLNEDLSAVVSLL
jgi:uncharacterized NAD-dependent epimerase/dehydratase family protein